jgi:nitrogen fixation protein FixH
MSHKKMMIFATIGLLITLFFGLSLKADQITHKFKSPSFSGINTSSHYFTAENQEFNRKKALKDEVKAYQEELAREADNTTLARFIRKLRKSYLCTVIKAVVDNLIWRNYQYRRHY